MNYLWCYCLPLLFLPNLGFQTETAFGTLTVSDYFVIPFIAFLWMRIQRKVRIVHGPRPHYFFSNLVSTLVIFVWWAFISSVSISFRYDYGDLNQTYFSLLKLAKLSLYGVAAILTIVVLTRAHQSEYQRFLWSLLASGILVGVTLLISGNTLQEISADQIGTLQVYQENPTSVMMAILIAFFVGMTTQHLGSALWQKYANFGLVVMALGFVFAQGRGGWFAALAALLYIGLNINMKQTFRILIVGLSLFIFTYSQNQGFRELIDDTFQPDPEFLARYNAGVAGIDDGARLGIFLAEAPKVLESPLVGRGFFHRGGLSGIYTTGSHNFFLQMFLETGIPGGLFILIVFIQMWQQASSPQSRERSLHLPTKAAILAAVVSGLSGEYFYGGTVLLVLIFTYAPVGCLESQQHTRMNAVYSESKIEQ